MNNSSIQLELEENIELPLGRVIKIKNKILDLTKPNIMGVLNVTNESFSDGGKYIEPSKAADRAFKIAEQGATILDIGAESTKPNSESISVQEELDRLCPVLEKLYNNIDIILSIDTSKPEVMEEVIKKYNIDIINDVRALRERDEVRDGLNILAEANIPVILMHMQGRPRNMQKAPKYENVISEIYNFLQHRIDICTKFGIKKSNIMIDPGFGFGKSWHDNASLLKYLHKFQDLACPIVAGLSRKSMIEQNNKGSVPMDKRLPGSLALATMAVERGANIIRCHDIEETRLAVDLAHAVLENGNCIDE